MGMFDYLQVDVPLPDGFEGRRFQTKSTPAQFLDLYKITPDGRLLYEQYESYTVPEEERPGYKEYKETGNDLLLLRGSLGRRNVRWVDTDYHGDIEFYDWSEDGNQSSGLVRFRVRFTEGTLASIELVERPPTEAKE
jgi:hypothetical protein